MLANPDCVKPETFSVIALSLLIGMLLVLVGGGIIGSTFLPPDRMMALPLPGGNVGRVIGAAVLLVGLAVPAVGISTVEPPPTPTPTLTATFTSSPAPTIALVGTVTPFPTPRPTRGTQAPVQALRADVTPYGGG